MICLSRQNEHRKEIIIMAEVKGEVEKKSNTNKEMVNVPETLGNTLTASQTQELSDKGFLDILGR